MNKICKLSMALVALLWVTTAVPMFKVFSRTLHQPQPQAEAEKLRDQALSEGDEFLKKAFMSLAVLLKGTALQKEIKEKFHSNKHNCTEVKQAVQALLEQKQKESDSDFSLDTTVLKIISDPDESLVGHSIVGFGGGPTAVELNLSKFPTSKSVVSTAAHEFVHIERGHHIKGLILDKVLDGVSGIDRLSYGPFNYTESSKKAEIISEVLSKCHEIEADTRSVIDQRRGSGKVALNAERLEGARDFLKHAHNAQRELYGKMHAFLQPVVENDIELHPEVDEVVRKFSENSVEQFEAEGDRRHPLVRERLENFDKLERLAQKQGGSLSKEDIDKHVAGDMYCKDALPFLALAIELTTYNKE